MSDWLSNLRRRLFGPTLVGQLMERCEREGRVSYVTIGGPQADEPPEGWQAGAPSEPGNYEILCGPRQTIRLHERTNLVGVLYHRAILQAAEDDEPPSAAAG